MQRRGATLDWVTPGRAAAGLALAWLVFGILELRRYGVTMDAPSLFYSGDRTLFWLGHRSLQGALDYAAPDPPGFVTAFTRFPDVRDPTHYPVLPAFVGALFDAVFHRKLGMLGALDAHQLGLVAMHAAALAGFVVYGSRFLGRVAGIAGGVALALFPCAVGHAFNNAKDWPCATTYGLAVLAFGSGLLHARARDVLAGAVFLGLSLSCKLNGVFVIPTIALWAPIAWALLYRRRRRMKPALVGWLVGAPYLAFAMFFVLWPWLYGGKTIADDWDRVQEYFGFLLHYGSGARTTWTAYPMRCVAYLTPPLVLVAAWSELVVGWLPDRRALARWSLLVLWTGLPLLRTAMPRSNFYDANRHFIEYVPGLCAMAGAGFARVLALLDVARSRVRLGAAVAGSLAIVAALVWPLVVYHPFEVTYFNAFVGGLGGAQKKRPFTMPPPHDFRATGTEGDYWATSIRDALRRVYIATPGVTHLTVTACDPAVAKAFVPIEWPSPYPPETPLVRDQADYLIVIPREGFCSPRDIPAIERGRPLLAHVERDGGIIYDLLGPKR